jgi:hypothetical protein
MTLETALKLVPSATTKESYPQAETTWTPLPFPRTPSNSIY